MMENPINIGVQASQLGFQENGFTHDLKRALNHARFNLAASYQGMAHSAEMS